MATERPFAYSENHVRGSHIIRDALSPTAEIWVEYTGSYFVNLGFPYAATSGRLGSSTWITVPFGTILDDLITVLTYYRQLQREGKLPRA